MVACWKGGGAGDHLNRRGGPGPTVGAESRWAKTGRTQAQIIRWPVLSGHRDTVVVAPKIAATHHAFSEFMHLAAAFDPIALIDRQPSDRAC